MSLLSSVSIRIKLILVIIFVTTLALVIGFVFIVAANNQSMREELQNNTVSMAKFIGEYSRTALDSDDRTGATEILRNIEHIPYLQNGCIFTPEGAVFVSYSRPESRFTFPAFTEQVHNYFDSGYLHVFQPVQYEGHRYGTIYLRASTSILESKLKDYLATIGTLLGGLILLSYILAIWLQRYISRPILRLANITRKVSESADYSLRAERRSNDELGILYDNFNAMMEQIKIHDEQNKKSEKALRDSESKYRILIEQIPTVTYAASLTETSTLLFVSPQVKSLLGYSPEEFTSDSEIYVRALHPDDYDLAMAKFNHPDTSQEQFIAEYRMYKSDGTIVWIHDEGTVVKDDAGKPLVLQGVMSDITERKHAEDELKSTRNYLKDVFDSLQSILVSVSPEGTITQWNKAAEKYTGITAADALRKKIWEAGPLLQNYQSRIIQVLQNQEPLELTREEFQGDEKKYLNVSIYPLTYHGGGAVLRIDDITELEKKDAQLRQAQKLETVGTLAGGLAHDFNNVLSGIIGSTSLIHFLLSNNKLDMDRLRSNLSTIETSATRAADMVQQLMTISKKHELSIAPMDLNQAIRHVVKICKSTFDKSIELNAVYYSRPAMVQADMAQIEQALLNLAVNASHAMTIMRQEFETQGGNLTIALEKIRIDRHFAESHPGVREGNHWIIRVIDTGVGMDAKTITKIFDPFFTTKEKSHGTGLGLAMVYNIIQKHNGYIDVYSNPGIGTTFNVLLPALEQPAGAIEKAPEEESMPRGSGKILVVDDEEIIRETTKNILELCGYTVLVAEDGFAGLSLFRDHFPDISVVLLDMAMPRKSGKETYIEMKKIKPDLKVVMASGFRQDKRVQEAIELGVNAFIQKPYSMLELAKKIKLVSEG